ncbi:MAG: DUF547 domain-containing protein [Phycisphaerae bacterium]
MSILAGFLLAGCLSRKEVDTVRGNTPGRLDYSPYQIVLVKYVSNGLVKYRSLKSDSRRLDEFMQSLTNVGPHGTPQYFAGKKQELAFWINVYNATAMQAAVRAYPVKTVNPILGNFENNVWLVVDGRRLTLNQIAELARRAGGYDPRIELAMILPAKGSGELPSEIYQAEKIEEQLNEAVNRALNNLLLMKIDHEHWTIWLGRSVYRVRQRFIDDYNKTYQTENATILNALGTFADTNQRRRLNSALGYHVTELKFDWSLNEMAQPPCSMDYLDFSGNK